MNDRIWSPQQHEVFVDFEEADGNTAVVARAGTGKTTTIEQAFRGVPSGTRAAAMAFNKSIATELSGRIPNADVRTFHSAGMQTVKRAFGSVAVDGDKARRIASDVLRAAGQTYRVLRNGAEEVRPSGVAPLCRLVSYAKNVLQTDEPDLYRLALARDLADEEYPADRMAKHAAEVLHRCAEDRTTIDFDDMIWFPAVHKLSRNFYELMVVDEAQDLNAAQIALVRGLMRRSGRLVIVGDDRQAIYAFRGATAGAMEQMMAEWQMKRLPLTITYRCPRSVVAHVNYIVPDYEAAPEAPEGIVRAGKPTEARPGDFVISRTNAPLIRLCTAALRAGVPATIAGRDIGKRLAEDLERTGETSTREAVVKIRARAESRAAMLAEGDEKKAQEIFDMAEATEALCDGETSTADVVRKIETLFSDADPKTRIVFTTAHKAKGLERGRVFLLSDTFRGGPGGDGAGGDQEANLYYVAATRAQRELVLCRTEERI